MSVINVRAKESTVEVLKDISKKTNVSQAQVVEKALDILNDLMDVKEQLEKEGNLNDTLALTVFARLMLNNIK